jgi:hypothetical protein
MTGLSADKEVLQPFCGERTFSVEPERSVLMVLIKVQYDAYNRQFRLVDRELTLLTTPVNGVRGSLDAVSIFGRVGAMLTSSRKVKSAGSPYLIL